MARPATFPGTANPPTALARTRSRRISWPTVVVHIILLFSGFLMVAPFLWMIITSFKPSHEIVTKTPHILPTHPTLSNYSALPDAAPFLRFFANSVIISGVSTIFVAFGCAAAGYALAKYPFRFLQICFALILATILIPLETYIIPLYLMMNRFGWVNTYQGMIFPFIIMSSGIFFLRQNILSIPDDLIDAARLDGASEFGIFWHIILPLSIAPIAAISIINWVYSWSMFIWPLIIASRTEMFTMEIGLMYFQRQFSVDYGGIMAACVITVLPVLIVFMIFRTRIIEGVATSGLK
ncbi:MAG TPA: carbohydrate ABC transporter permease [Thermomicrobiales bacterium]|jgi:multiple sugar transport system permease protein|nr:carbohydrate ABC transporter permease [Thermomicrobiales bacterium]